MSVNKVSIECKNGKTKLYIDDVEIKTLYKISFKHEGIPTLSIEMDLYDYEFLYHGTSAEIIPFRRNSNGKN